MSARNTLLALAVPGILLASATSALPQDWTLTSAPITNWTFVAFSADGHRLVATAGNGIYISTNSGITWSLTSAPGSNWASVASSADGRKLVATKPTGNYGSIYTSTNWGTSWIQTVDNGRWSWGPIASASDGNRLVIGGGRILTSTNSGADWTLVGGDYFPAIVGSTAASADGFIMAATANTGGLPPVGGSFFVSTNSFATLSGTIFGNTISPTSVALSADGTRVIVAANSGQILSSTNSGISFVQTSAPNYPWFSVASSTDGNRLVAAASWYFSTGPIYTSADAGNTWQSNAAPVAIWSSVASSADGCKLVAAVNGGGIYTTQTSPTPVLNITPSDSSVLISWIVPSMPFVLQENSDLTTTNWTDVTTTPILNFANLHHEVSVPLSSTNRFYRLKGL